MTSAVNHAHLTIYQLLCARITLWSKKRRFFGQNGMCETKFVNAWLLFMSRGPGDPVVLGFPAIALLITYLRILTPTSCDVRHARQQ